MNFIWQTLGEIWNLLGEMAPYLLLGFLMAGVLHVFLRPELVERVLGRQGVWSNVKATLLGIPLPICSCGVLPLAASLKREGASSGSTISFLTATPQTGVDSILATQALMGPVFTTFRVVVAFISGLLSGTVVDLVERLSGVNRKGLEAKKEASECCCSGEPQESESNCCAHANEGSEERQEGWGSKVRRALHYGLVRLPQDLAWPLIVGLFLAALVAVFVPVDWAKQWLDQPWLVYVAITLLAVPLYVCSTGSIPLAFALMNVGISPGAALVFLITGPATNAATLSVVVKQMGWRVLGGFLASLLLVAWSAGWVFDQLDVFIPLEKHHEHEQGVSFWFTQISAITLSGILLYAWIWPKLRPLFRRDRKPTGINTGERVEQEVEG